MSRNRRPNRESHIYNPSIKPLSKVFSHHEYFNYYKNLLVENNMKHSTFNRMIEAESNQIPCFFRIKADGTYKKKLQSELEHFLPIFKKSKVRKIVFTCLEEKYGTMAQIFFAPYMIKYKPNLQGFYDWLNSNTQAGFLTRFNFSTLIPFIFLDVQPSDSIISIYNSNNQHSTEIISEILDDGYIFVNVPDIKVANTDFGFGSSNYCVINYPILQIPDIQEFDKVLCIAPSIEDGSIRNNPGVDSVWSIDDAVANHDIQKQYLISALEKVKVGGICVYSTYSINPFENEAVINSVLKMEQYEGKFEIVDCTDNFKEIKRKKGLTSWDLNGISTNQKDQKFIQSISSDSLISGMENCMRFYPHQTNSNGVFVAVIKKLGEIDKKYTLPLPENENKNTKSGSRWVSNLSKVPHSIIKKIIEDFGLPSECEKISFIYSQTPNVNILFNVTKKLEDMLSNNFLNKLNLCHIGARAFSFSSNYPEEPSIPSVQYLPDIARHPTERLITITLDNFKEMTESCQISVDKLSKANQAYLNSISTGGIYIILENFGPLLGGLWKDPVVRLIIKKGAASKLFKMAEQILFENENNEYSQNEDNNNQNEEENDDLVVEEEGNQENAKEPNGYSFEETVLIEENSAPPQEEEQQQVHKKRRRKKSSKEDE